MGAFMIQLHRILSKMNLISRKDARTHFSQVTFPEVLNGIDYIAYIKSLESRLAKADIAHAKNLNRKASGKVSDQRYQQDRMLMLAIADIESDEIQKVREEFETFILRGKAIHEALSRDIQEMLTHFNQGVHAISSPNRIVWQKELDQMEIPAFPAWSKGLSKPEKVYPTKIASHWLAKGTDSKTSIALMRAFHNPLAIIATKRMDQVSKRRWKREKRKFRKAQKSPFLWEKWIALKQLQLCHIVNQIKALEFKTAVLIYRGKIERMEASHRAFRQK